LQEDSGPGYAVLPITFLLAPRRVETPPELGSIYRKDVTPPDLWIRQKPEVLEALREQAIIQSAESSNRIEGVTIPPDRLRPVVLGKSKPRSVFGQWQYTAPCWS